VNYYSHNKKLINLLYERTPRKSSYWSPLIYILDREYHAVADDEEFAEHGHIYTNLPALLKINKVKADGQKITHEIPKEEQHLFEEQQKKLEHEYGHLIEEQQEKLEHEYGHLIEEQEKLNELRFEEQQEKLEQEYGHLIEEEQENFLP